MAKLATRRVIVARMHMTGLLSIEMGLFANKSQGNQMCAINPTHQMHFTISVYTSHDIPEKEFKWMAKVYGKVCAMKKILLAGCAVLALCSASNAGTTTLPKEMLGKWCSVNSGGDVHTWEPTTLLYEHCKNGFSGLLFCPGTLD
jgi:hypothetical protein